MDEGQYSFRTTDPSKRSWEENDKRQALGHTCLCNRLSLSPQMLLEMTCYHLRQILRGPVAEGTSGSCQNNPTKGVWWKSLSHKIKTEKLIKGRLKYGATSRRNDSKHGHVTEVELQKKHSGRVSGTRGTFLAMMNVFSIAQRKSKTQRHLVRFMIVMTAERDPLVYPSTFRSIAANPCKRKEDCGRLRTGCIS